MLVRVLLVVALVLPLPLSAQEVKTERPRQVYKLDYVIAELESGKRVDAREYTMLIEGDREMPRSPAARLRVGNRIPIATGVNPATGQSQFQYIDVGVNIDALARYASDTTVGLKTTVEVSSVVVGGGEADKVKVAPGQVVTRNFRTENEALLPLGKPMVLFTLDEPNSKRSFQIQVTATPVR